MLRILYSLVDASLLSKTQKKPITAQRAEAERMWTFTPRRIRDKIGIRENCNAGPFLSVCVCVYGFFLEDLLPEESEFNSQISLG